MKEFGSDFHYINISDFVTQEHNPFENYQFYANGRQAIQQLIVSNNWGRVWMPEYFCYDIIDAIRKTGIKVVMYPDAPGFNDNTIIEGLPFRKNDVLLRMNFFGLRSFRDNNKLSVDVIEDHSHDLTGNWASNSNADWCFASLRKTIPMAEGGALWSPKQFRLPQSPEQSKENIQLSEKRWQAMKLKKEYLENKGGNKGVFRALYIDTENAFEKLPISAITVACKEYIEQFDIESWNKKKKENWEILTEVESDNIKILLPEDKECNVFSFVFVLKSESEKEQVRQHLVQNKLYPVVLWQIPENAFEYGLDISKRMLSIPCDARYNSDDMIEMRGRLEKALELINR